MEFVRKHKNLEVWKSSMALVKDIYSITRPFPTEEKFGLTSQLRRAGVSVPCNIAEGAGRKSTKELINFLHISQGSLSEIDTLVEICLMLEFIDTSKLNPLMEKVNTVSFLLNNMINKLKERVENEK